MIRTRGRPLGSKDRLPREKRTKLQLMVDQQLGVDVKVKKDAHIEVQRPCDKCGSCVRVEFKYPADGEHQLPYFLTQLVSERRSNVNCE